MAELVQFGLLDQNYFWVEDVKDMDDLLEVSAEINKKITEHAEESKEVPKKKEKNRMFWATLGGIVATILVITLVVILV